MSTGMWITIILTSPFWMVLGVVGIFFLFILLVVLLEFIGEVWEQFCRGLVKGLDSIVSIFRRRK